MKKRIVTLLLTLLTILSLLPTAVMAAESTGVGITPVTDPNLWTTRLNSQGQSYSYRPPTAAGRQLYCMDLGYSYRYGTESFLQSYTYRSATGGDADDLWNDAVRWCAVSFTSMPMNRWVSDAFPNSSLMKALPAEKATPSMC